MIPGISDLDAQASIPSMTLPMMPAMRKGGVDRSGVGCSFEYREGVLT
jgi:hypothetical protein